MDRLPTADYYLGLSDTFLRHAAEIDQSGTAHPLAWHVHAQLQSLAAKAFDIQACILRAATTQGDTDMNITLPFDLTVTQMPEICDTLGEVIAMIDSRMNEHGEGHDSLLRTARQHLSKAISSIDDAESALASYAMDREDRPAHLAIVAELNKCYDSDNNAPAARGMLEDIASPSGARRIMAAIRDAGYTVTPLG